ncbi:MAG: flagellar basal body rod protein FlgB [Proteobacteria bacterium]|nr:flagellar basal body rod protein FlgB [Pseudomonadota bacterium]
MDITRLPLFGMIARRMDWLSHRQTVLSQNVANADTPNYQPRDLKAIDFRAEMRKQTARLSAATTSPEHLTSRLIAGPDREDKPRPGETTLSGNSVQMDTELMKVADTAMDYQMTTNIYRRQLAMLRSAIGRNS